MTTLQNDIPIPPPGWQPQPQADEYLWSDETVIAPVDAIYPTPTAVHVVPSQRMVHRNLYMDSITDIKKLCDKSEVGIGSRITLQLHPASTASVAIGANMADLVSGSTYQAVYGAVPSQAFVLPFLAASYPPPLQFFTCDQLWCKIITAGHAMLSVIVEQFYGEQDQ